MHTFAARWFICFVAGASALLATNLDREIVLTAPAGASPAEAEVVRWQARASGPQARAEDFERLAWGYVAEARVTGDAGYYKLAEKTATVLEAQFGATAESVLLRGHVAHNLHHFAAAETLARQVVAERGSPADLALLSDALVEQGRLAEAIPVLQRLTEAKPGLEAFCRISYLRWLKGDLPGAIGALERALPASSPRERETRAWLFVRLSGLYLQRGDTGLALQFATNAAELLPDHPPALFARARVLIATRQVPAAIPLLRQAVARQPLPEYQWWLADALAATGDAAGATAAEAALRRHGATEDPRSFALFLATREVDVSSAVRLARAELALRRDVFTHDALAWALAAAGDLKAAALEMKSALAEGTQDARLELHAGEIARARGDHEGAARHLALAQRDEWTLAPSERARLRRDAAATFSRTDE
jgi:tetratricopeptide (TPR) repeat protein